MIVLLWTMLTLFGAGAFGALAFGSHDTLARVWGNTFAALGSVAGGIFSSLVLMGGQTVSYAANSAFPLLSFNIQVDQLAALFVLLICFVAFFCSLFGLSYAKSFHGRYNLGALGLFYNLFIAAMLLVVVAANGLFFLLAWEIMALASYFLVVYDRQDPKNVKAGFLYLVMTHIGTACLLVAMAIMFSYAHSFDFAAFKEAAPAMPDLAKGAVFILAFVGLGTKAGVIPMHIWLPAAHPAAPSHVSALMSGVMIKTGIYMMLRLFIDILQPIPMWWGVVVLIAGAIACVMGVLYALTEHDIKRLLAYHSIENIGIILLGLGSALVFSALGQPLLVTLSLAAALFHTVNHAIFKALLFLSAGSVVHAMHSRNIEDYGGLIKYMPLTALFFLIGSMAISALPPLNGFYSEWLTFQALFEGINSGNALVMVMMLAAVAALALTGGLALACFVKAFGATFLARPRTAKVAHAKEATGWMVAAMGGMAVACVALGVGSGYVVPVLQGISQQIAHLTVATISAVQPAVVVSGTTASVSAPFLAVALASVGVGVWLVTRYVVNRRQKVTIDLTWDCGTNLTPRMEITSTGFARSIVMIFKKVLKPTKNYELEYDDGASRYTPATRTLHLGINDIYRKRFYHPIHNFAHALSARTKTVHNGNINLYLLYIFAVLVLTLVVEVS